MTRCPLLTCAIGSTVVLFGIGCGGKTHVVGSVADGSAGSPGSGGDSGPVGSGGVLTGSGGGMGSGGWTSMGSVGGAGGSGVDSGMPGSGGLKGSDGAPGSGGSSSMVGSGGVVGTGGSGGTVGSGGRASGGGVGSGGAINTGGVIGTGGAIRTGGAGGRGGSGGAAPPVDGGRPLQNPQCCSFDEECKEGYECAGGTCEYVLTLTAGQCWRDSDCPASSGACVGAGICGCVRLCESPDHPGTCGGPVGTGGAGGRSGTGGVAGSGGVTGTGGAGGAGDTSEYTACEYMGDSIQERIYRIDRVSSTCTEFAFSKMSTLSCPLGLTDNGWCLSGVSLSADIANCANGRVLTGTISPATGATGTFLVTSGSPPSIDFDLTFQFAGGAGLPQTVHAQASDCKANCAATDCRR
jgi:hypothetical protein